MSLKEYLDYLLFSTKTDDVYLRISDLLTPIFRVGDYTKGDFFNG